MDDTAELAKLLEHFDVTSLGDGDPTAGFNLLACMACTLAQLAPDNGMMVHKDGSYARLGTSLMVLGSASSGRVVDEIVTELNHIQNNLATNVESYFDWLAEIAAKPQPFEQVPRSCNSESARMVSMTQQSDPHGLQPDYIPTWSKVLGQLPHQSIGRIGKHPKFLVSAGGRKDIESQLTRLCPGPPLVHLGLTHPDDIVRHADVGAALLDGSYPLEDGIRSVKGNLLITDPMHVLTVAAQKPDERTRWLGQLLWLADGNFGPDVPLVKPACEKSASAGIEERFRQSLVRIMLYRLNLPTLQPLLVSSQSREAKVRWSTFLREMEPRLPGITGAARNLITALSFGLLQLAPKYKDMTESGIEAITLSGIEAMARFLIRRMANARISILRGADLARKCEQITRIFHKLSTGPVHARRLCRDLKISAAERDEALSWLEAASLVVSGQDGLQLREGARLSFRDSAVPVIEV